MNAIALSKFDLIFPSSWIGGTDRNVAFETGLILGHIEGAFVEAVAACSLFGPLTREKVSRLHTLSRYESCLDSIYAKAFVFSLHDIGKLLRELSERPDAPAGLKSLYYTYWRYFGHAKHMRDSVMHVEDRGIGLNKLKERIKANLLILGSFIGSPEGTRFVYTGADGKQYEIEISEATLETVHEILQSVINSYPWEC